MKNIIVTVSGLLFLISTQTKGQAPTATFTATPNPVCAGSCVTFVNTSTNAPTSFLWYFPGGIPSYSLVTTFPGDPGCIIYPNPGVYTASLVVSNGSGKDSVTNTITVDALPNLKIFPPSGGICDTAADLAFDTIYFAAIGASTYTWTPSYGLSCTNCPNPRAYPAITTVYTVTGTGPDGCTSTITDTVTAGFIKAKIWGDDTICPGQSDTLIASGGSSSPPGSTYIWSNGKTTSEIVVNPTINTTYTCEIISGFGGCSYFASFTIVTACTGIETIANPSELEIIPNPATAKLSVLLRNPSNKSSILSLIDITGREIYSQTLKPFQSRSEINISSLSRGMYFIKIKTENSESIKKFVKE